MKRFSASLSGYKSEMRRFIAFCLAAASVAACDNDPAADWSAWERREMLGLSFASPPEMKVSLGDTWITMSSDPMRRRVDYITLSIDALPDHMDRTEIALVLSGESPAPHVILDDGGGSGGIEYRLITNRVIGGRNIVVASIIQSEDGTPAFRDAWAVWESLRPADQAASDVSTSRAQ